MGISWPFTFQRHTLSGTLVAASQCHHAHDLSWRTRSERKETTSWILSRPITHTHLGSIVVNVWLVLGRQLLEDNTCVSPQFILRSKQASLGAVVKLPAWTGVQFHQKHSSALSCQKHNPMQWLWRWSYIPSNSAWQLVMFDFQGFMDGPRFWRFPCIIWAQVRHSGDQGSRFLGLSPWAHLCKAVLWDRWRCCLVLQKRRQLPTVHSFLCSCLLLGARSPAEKPIMKWTSESVGPVLSG